MKFDLSRNEKCLLSHGGLVNLDCLTNFADEIMCYIQEVKCP